MPKFYLLKRIIFYFICFLISNSIVSSESISICQSSMETVECVSDHYIVLLDARVGTLPRLDRENYSRSRWCRKSDSYYNSTAEGCVTSRRRELVNLCTGYNSCRASLLPSEYLGERDSVCGWGKANLGNMAETSLYIDYECVPKELFFAPDGMDNIHFIGGYITSIGYSLMKANYDKDAFRDLAEVYRESNLLPITKVFRPKLILENSLLESYLFQLQIIENSVSSSNQSFIDKPCTRGKLYSEDYYGFTPINETQTDVGKSNLSICRTKSDMVGQVFGPIMAKEIKIEVNVNFNSFARRALLIKFTTILCPLLVIENANVTYDHVVDTGRSLVVYGLAVIKCKDGFFLSSLSNVTRKVSLKYLACNHDTGSWNESQPLEKCVDSFLLPIKRSTTIMSVTTIIKKDSSFKALYFSTSSISSIINTTTSNTSTFIVRSKAATVTIRRRFITYAVPVLIVLILICVLLPVLVWRFRDKIKCSFFEWYSNLRCNKDTIPHTNYLVYPRASMRNSYQHNFIFDDNIPMTESLNFTLSPNGSCMMQSNHTLITRAGSRPTIISGDSMQNSNYIFDTEVQILQEDELPTKLPKTSTLSKLMRSASSLRNNSLGRMRPKSLNRQSFADGSSNFFDAKFSGSQIPLLLSRRPNISSQLMDSNSVMYTSDITPSQPLPRTDIIRRKINNNNRSYSHSNSSFQLNNCNRVISPTVDTYLEPTESSITPYEILNETPVPQIEGRKNSDYMVYDHSRISSNNPDTTCQSSVIASLSDENANDEEDRKRFSMISNHYYGMQDQNLRSNDYPFTSNSDFTRFPPKSNSNESVYESIDDDHMDQNTLDRRQIALPPPPIEN